MRSWPIHSWPTPSVLLSLGLSQAITRLMYEHILQTLLFRRTNPLTRSRGGDHRVSFLCVMRRAELAKFMRKIGRLNVARLPTHKRRSLKGLSRYLRILPLPRQRCWVSPLSLSPFFAQKAAAHGGVLFYSIGGTWYNGWSPYNTPTGQTSIQRPWSS